MKGEWQMKRIVACALVMLALCMGTAAAEWMEGTSPSRPYAGVPEVNLDDQLGYMMFYPSEWLPAESACRKLYIYLPRTDVKAGNGAFSLITSEGDEVFSASMDDPDAVAQRDISEKELSGLIWGGGTCFEIMLPRSLELGETYFANLEPGCIVTENGMQSPQIEMDGEYSWRFTLEGEYGVSAMTYRRPLPDGSYEDGVLRAQAGDDIRFDLTLGGDAAAAAIYGYADSVDFLVTMIEVSTEVTGEVLTKNPAWGVMFLDAQGNELRRVEFW